VSYATIDDLRSQLGAARTPDQQAAYDTKMKHPIPPYRNVDRMAFILERCKGKRVLEFGASGPLTAEIRKVASRYIGVDRDPSDGIHGMDLDDVRVLIPNLREIDVIVCGEVLEHLGNPLHFLMRLRSAYAGTPMIVSVPNAFSRICQDWIKKGIENVNADHVAWYSPKTLSVLLQRAGYTTADLFFYNGDGPTAEGLIVVTE
jgi:hypothetical protein